jgi:drug/metabolite transporter (DMT)-like permease
MTNHFSMKRAFLYTVIVTLVLTALMGIYVLLAGQFGEMERKILLTTVAVSFFSMMSLACAAAHEKGRDHWPLSIPGIVLGAAGLVFYVAVIWADRSVPEMTWKWVAIVGIFSFSFAQASVLSLMSLEERVRWVFYAAVVSIMALAVFVSGMIVAEPRGEEWSIRVAGVLGILDACLSLCVPIVYRLGRNESATTMAQTYCRIDLTCPRCGERGTYPIGKITCGKCSLALRVEIG